MPSAKRSTTCRPQNLHAQTRKASDLRLSPAATRVVEAGRNVITIVRRDIEQLLHDVESAMAAGHDPQAKLKTIEAAELFIRAVKRGVSDVVRGLLVKARMRPQPVIKR